MAASLCEENRAELQPDGSILLVPEDYSRPTDTNPDIKSEALRELWRMRSSEMSRRDMAYLLRDLDSTVSWADVAGVSHSKGVHSKVSLCEPPLLWSTFCGRWCLTPYTPSIWV